MIQQTGALAPNTRTLLKRNGTCFACEVHGIVESFNGSGWKGPKGSSLNNPSALFNGGKATAEAPDLGSAFLENWLTPGRVKQNEDGSPVRGVPKLSSAKREEFYHCR